jgi:hypothetical protein
MSNSIINIKVMPRFENFRVNGKDDSTIFFFFVSTFKEARENNKRTLANTEAKP